MRPPPLSTSPASAHVSNNGADLEDDDFPEELLEEIAGQEEELDAAALDEEADQVLEEEIAEEQARTFQQADSYLQRLARVQEGLSSVAVVRHAAVPSSIGISRPDAAESRSLLDLKQRLAQVKARSPTKSPAKASILAQVSTNVPPAAAEAACAPAPAGGDSTKKLADIRAWIENVKATQKS